jgi:oxygen-independent coproporphyrinogen-3 oxidase
MAAYLYIHVPFCVRKCIYCDFTSISYDGALVKSYAEALCTELRLKKNLAGELKTVYIGGGTPSLMPEDFFEGLFSCLKEIFTPSLSAEISVEANPGTLSRPKIETLLSLGVNRVSIGVQSLRDDELRKLGRVHTSEEALRSARLVKELGGNNLSLDLMYGIPGQTLETWRETLKKTMDIGPSHISAYELTPEEKTPLYRLLQKGEIELPDEGEILEMYDCAVDFFSSHSYEHYEISNFARPGFRCLHNMNYWNRGEYIAAGAGAHSFLRGLRSKNTPDVRAYIERLQEGLTPDVETTEVTPDEKTREFIFLGLRKREGIDLKDSEICETGIASAVEDLVDRGYLEIVSDRLRFTRKGIVLSNSIIVSLFERLRL